LPGTNLAFFHEYNKSGLQYLGGWLNFTFACNKRIVFAFLVISGVKPSIASLPQLFPNLLLLPFWVPNNSFLSIKNNLNESWDYFIRFPCLKNGSLGK